MLGRMMIAVRLMVVLAFLVGMPVLALPQVADWCEARLYPQVGIRQRQIVAKPAPASAILVADEIPVPAISIPNRVETADFTHPFESSAQAAPPEFMPVVAVAPAKPRDPLVDRQEIARLEAELQRLGAIFYRLEAPQSPNLPYQFVAQFERQAGLPERFQVTTSNVDPIEAMRQMVAQVQSRISVARP